MWLDTVIKMIRENKDVQLAGLSNIEEVSTRKSGWGYVKIAIPNNLAHKLLTTNEYGGGLLLFSNEQFNQIDTTDNTSVDESNQKIDGGVNQNG